MATKKRPDTGESFNLEFERAELLKTEKLLKLQLLNIEKLLGNVDNGNGELLTSEER